MPLQVFILDRLILRIEGWFFPGWVVIALRISLWRHYVWDTVVPRRQLVSTLLFGIHSVVVTCSAWSSLLWLSKLFIHWILLQGLWWILRWWSIQLIVLEGGPHLFFKSVISLKTPIWWGGYILDGLFLISVRLQVVSSTHCRFWSDHSITHTVAIGVSFHRVHSNLFIQYLIYK